jgi:PiT family inorganic phosphate transporter
MSIQIIVVVFAVFLALLFNFTNGFHDVANQVATAIKTDAIKPLRALIIAATFDFVGAFFLGSKVAETFGKGIVDPNLMTKGTSSVLVVIAALFGAILWNLWTWKTGTPSSSSHALIGGLLGAFVVGWGFAPVDWLKILGVFGILVASPLVGFAVASILTRIGIFVSSIISLPARTNTFFRKAQYVTLISQALSHGTNDAQKSMGVIVFVLAISGLYARSSGGAYIPTWVVLACSIALALGAMCGGWRIIRTLGWGIYDIKPIHSFMSQLSSTSIIYVSSLFGYPISTTQVISSSVMGAGAAENPRRVHWEVAKDMAFAWLVTIPASAAVSATFLLLFRGMWFHVIGIIIIALLAYMIWKKISLSRIFPKPLNFLNMLSEQAGVVYEGLKTAQKYCEKPSPEAAKTVDEAERSADEVHHGIIANIRKTFITGKYDRHNIDNLSQRIDDIMDEVKKAVMRMEKFEVPPDNYIVEMLSKLSEAVVLIKEAVDTLATDQKRCGECVNAARKRENTIQHIYEGWYGKTESEIKVDVENLSTDQVGKVFRAMIRNRDEEKVQNSFIKAADAVVMAAAELETMLSKVS